MGRLLTELELKKISGAEDIVTATGQRQRGITGDDLQIMLNQMRNDAIQQSMIENAQLMAQLSYGPEDGDVPPLLEEPEEEEVGIETLVIPNPDGTVERFEIDFGGTTVEVDNDDFENQLAELKLENALLQLEGISYSVEYDQDRGVYVATPPPNV